MDELPSVQLAEAQVDCRSASNGACGADARPQQEQGFDEFELDALELDDDLALHDVDSAMGCSPAPRQNNVLVPHPPAQRKSEAHSREDVAQYMKKAKVRSTSEMYMRCAPRQS